MSKASTYKLNQVFGYKGPNEKIQYEDIINTIKFNKNGEMLALGDKAGRVIIFKAGQKQKPKENTLEYYAQFQAHMQQFDCLRSKSVSESIKDICWLNNQNKYHKLLTTNSNSIKLWKLFQKPERKIVSRSSKPFTNITNQQVKIPKLETVDSSFISHVQTSFPSRHISEIHSISTSHNQEYVLSFDDVQCFMWSLEKPQKPYILINYLKNLEIDDAKQKISCGKFHPNSDSIMIYGTNKKTLKLHDMRISLNQNENGTIFKSESKESKNFFTDLLGNYTSVDFIKNGKYIVARDLLTVKVWDVCQTKKPLLEVTLQQNYKSKLCEMYENDCIYDKFQVKGTNNGNSIITGNYNNNFHFIDIMEGTNSQFQLSYKKQTIKKNMVPGKFSALEKIDYGKKVSALDFNTKSNMFAVASENCFFLYSHEK